MVDKVIIRCPDLMWIWILEMCRTLNIYVDINVFLGLSYSPGLAKQCTDIYLPKRLLNIRSLKGQ